MIKNYQLANTFNITERKVIELLKNGINLKAIYWYLKRDKLKHKPMNNIKDYINQCVQDEKVRADLTEMLNNDYRAEYLKGYMNDYVDYIGGE